MSQPSHEIECRVSISRFNANNYAKTCVDLGSESPLDHYLRIGVDEGRAPKMSREMVSLRGGIERYFVSESGLFAVLGWCADEGIGDLEARIYGSDFSVQIPSGCIFRHARPDIEQAVRPGAFDYGFVVIGRTPSRTLLKQTAMLSLSSHLGGFQGKCEPELVSDKRFLDTLLVFLKNSQSHAGKECRLFDLMSGGAGTALSEAFDRHVLSSGREAYVESFGKRRVSRSFITVLFGSTEPVLLQPVLFHNAGIDFGEWVYVCNSPEDGTALLRVARLISTLYDLFITVIVLGDNVGFGAANNMAISHASGAAIYIVNPDVYPVTAYIPHVKRTLERGPSDAHLWGGLLFYDDHNLMHSGMYLDRDRFFACKTGQRSSFRDNTPASIALMRVEHFDKGVPFHENRWAHPKVVPSISGALMTFDRRGFEKLGGFSTRFIYGHYEDADLSIRWANEIGRVQIDPDLRLVHLEGQGSRSRGEQFAAAAMINRYFFSIKYNDAFEQDVSRFTKANEVSSSSSPRTLMSGRL